MVLSLLSFAVVLGALIYTFPRASQKDNFAYKAVFIVLLVYLGIWYSNTFIPAFFNELEALMVRKLSYNEYTKKMEIPLIQGKLSLSDASQHINVDKNPGNSSADYIYMPRSVDRNGIEMTYCFWFKKPPTSADIKGKPIFLKGSKESVATFNKGLQKSFDRDTNISNSTNGKDFYREAGNNNTYFTHNGDEYLIENPHKGVLVKSPLVRFGSDEETSYGNYKDYLVIECNTLNDPHKKIVIGGNETQFELLQSNNIWNLISIVFKNTRDYSNFINGFQITIMINDKHVKTEMYQNETLRLNNGPFYVLPNIENTSLGSDSGYIADIRYFNYAITTEEIQKIQKKGPTLSKGEVNRQNKNINENVVRQNEFGLLNSLKIG